MELQGDRTKKVGVIDSEFIVHKGIPSLGGPSANKVLNPLHDSLFQLFAIYGTKPKILGFTNPCKKFLYDNWYRLNFDRSNDCFLILSFNRSEGSQLRSLKSSRHAGIKQ
ncbi:hypothetical protein BHM03_00038865 [Ensete ventricosum]|nr:hypothetical protein BHM03_00038865 [Ensete ventricosum]